MRKKKCSCHLRRQQVRGVGLRRQQVRDVGLRTKIAILWAYTYMTQCTSPYDNETIQSCNLMELSAETAPGSSVKLEIHLYLAPPANMAEELRLILKQQQEKTVLFQPALLWLTVLAHAPLIESCSCQCHGIQHGLHLQRVTAVTAEARLISTRVSSMRPFLS